MKIKSEYQGVVLTDRYLQVHFRLTIGDTAVRHHHVKIPLDEFAKEIWARAIDTASRRRLIELWSQEQELLPPWSDD